MNADALTWSALIVALITVVVLFVLIQRMNRYKDDLRCAVKHMHDMQHNEELHQLCLAIRQRYPDLCGGVDYELATGEQGAYVRKWMNKNPEPDREQIQRMLDELKQV